MKKILFVLANLMILTACGDKSKKDYLVTIKTSYGDMKVLLYEETPLHKENFIELAKSGRYDSTIFHRVIENFMIQGGNIYEKEGTREPENARIPAEIIEGFYHTRGALAAARQPDNVNPEKLSSSCQFYIIDGNSWEVMSTDQRLLNQKLTELLEDPEYSELLAKFQELAKNRDSNGMNNLALENKALVEEKFGIDLTIDPKTGNNEAYKELGGYHYLDNDYTVFGKVVDGLDVIDKIAAVKKGGPNQSRPIEPIYLTMEVEEVKKKEITKLYGYEYPSKK
ncbi:MAG: peptidylprolyl isomerase [Cyclobacteriaceae bacterium]